MAVRVSIPRPPRDGFDGSRPVPKFMQNDADPEETVWRVPTSLAKAAAGVLAVDASCNTSIVEASKKFTACYPGLCAPRPLERRSSSARRTPRARWPPEPASPRAMCRAALQLKPDDSGKPHGHLHFGDMIRLVLPDDRGIRAALSTCAPPNQGDGAGARRIAGTDAVAEEQRLASELASSGRTASGFVAVTAAPLERTDEHVTRRSVWELYRADHSDGFKDDVVRYGQLFSLGQRPVSAGARSEVLLSCEPPSRNGGMAAPYLVLGRYVDYGHPDPRDESRKAWDTIFMFAPGHKAAGIEGDPVNFDYAVRIVPVSPYSYLHGKRALQAVPGVVTNGLEPGCTDRTVRAADARELLVHAARPMADQRLERSIIEKSLDRQHSHILVPEHTGDDLWMVQILDLHVDSIDSSDRNRREQHKGVARALLGRALGPPPAAARAIAGSATPSIETPYARWDHFRNVLFRRLIDRNDQFIFSTFRKVLSKNREFDRATKLSTNRMPLSDGKPILDERMLVSAERVRSILFLDFGLTLSEEDVSLMSRRFGCLERPEDTPSLEQLIDADLFADALRGEGKPGRRLMLQRLYSLLQVEAGLPPEASLDIWWLRSRIESADSIFVQIDNKKSFSVEDVMNALPLLRTHGSLTRTDFIRWMLDVSLLLLNRTAFIQRLTEFWGPVVQGVAGSSEEVFNWDLPFP